MSFPAPYGLRTMFKDTRAFSGFAVDDVPRAAEFYGETLGLETSIEHGMLTLHLAGDRPTLVYPKPEHTPADYTILNFPVDDIEQAVDELARRGVETLRFDGHARRRARHHARGRTAHRLVHGPGRQRALGPAGRLGRGGHLGDRRLGVVVHERREHDDDDRHARDAGQAAGRRPRSAGRQPGDRAGLHVAQPRPARRPPARTPTTCARASHPA